MKQSKGEEILPETRAVFTDLDGTLLNSQQLLTSANRHTLNTLGEAGIRRIVVTGRSLFSAQRVLDMEFPIDLLVTSSGAGIFSFPALKMLYSATLTKQQVQRAALHLKYLELDFMIHAPLPDNHRFGWHRSGRVNADFDRRIELYSNYSNPLPIDLTTAGPATQLLVICPHNEDGRLHRTLKVGLSGLTVIRTTSPLDHRSTWYEIFPSEISKASAAIWICNRYGLDRDTTLVVGNDYNDLALLHWGQFSRVVANAPTDLRCQFQSVASHDHDGFSEAVAAWLEALFIPATK